MNNKSHNKLFMRHCIRLAEKGRGNVAPNPMVGAVIVYNNKIIGEGYHRKYGEAHAEVNAINSVSDKSLLQKSTIYVSLEPCAHFGKTPPCADLIVSYKIPRVVIGMQDPFAKVNGLGIKKLESAGCNVTVGVLEKECENLNKEFITFHTKKRPYIILKWAQTIDGFIDKTRTGNDKQKPNWITDEICRSLVHKWRTEIQAIMVGTNTAAIDNPKLNVRLWEGNSPLRIVIDKNLKLSENLFLFDKTVPTIVLNEVKNSNYNNIEYKKINFSNNFLNNLMDILYKKGINSLFVEGGLQLLNSFIENNLWDEARIFTGNIEFKEGVVAPDIKGKKTSINNIGNSILSVYHPNSGNYN
jgi:diaminohydroxyphosphoribosylaminopyrimidine deaminase/5-amino-6-(5-phosphoribosylamino)uracil reductase